MLDLLDRISQLDTYTVFATILIVFVGTPMLVEGVKKWKNMLNKNGQEKKEASVGTKLDELDHKIDDKVSEASNELHAKQEIYHNQSIAIREELKANQETLQSGQDSLREDVSSLKNDVKELRHILQEYIRKDNEKTVATLRTSLWRMHKMFTEQGYVTPDGLKTFIEEGKVYEKAGGDDIYHDKLLPEVLALDIHYPDGSIYKQSEITKE